VVRRFQNAGHRRHDVFEPSYEFGFKTWSDEYAGMPFSAHPKIERDGSLWNFGITSSQGLLSIYHVAPSGRLIDASTIKVPEIAMVHDFAVTERHLVFLLPPFIFDDERARAGKTFLASHVWPPNWSCACSSSTRTGPIGSIVRAARRLRVSHRQRVGGLSLRHDPARLHPLGRCDDRHDRSARADAGPLRTDAQRRPYAGRDRPEE
jgi:hypothetical protein